MISVVVPVYGVEKYLPQCVESLINQTYRDIEIILVDDGSPDRCSQICDEYSRRDARIVAVHKKNGGVSSARNAGLKIAQGDYVAFVDPDDWVAPETYEAALDASLKTGADLAIYGYEYCDDDGTIDETRNYKSRETEILTQRETMKRMSDIPPTLRHGVWNKLFHRDLIGETTFKEDLRASEDVWFLSECLLKTKSVVCVHEPYYFNRVREGSATHGGLSILDLARSFQAHSFMHQSFTTLYPDLKSYSQRFLLDVFLLKYNESKRKILSTPETEKQNSLKALRQMRKALRTEAWKALFNRDIYWKTRLAYLLVR